VAGSRRRAAVDTSVLLNVFTGGAHDPPERLEHSLWVLEAAEGGEHDLVVPAIAIAELGGHPKIRSTEVERSERRRRIDEVRQWIDNSRFLVAELTLDVATRAVDFAIEYEMKGADASIVAAASINGCSVLYSWDNGQVKIANQITGLHVLNPERKGSQQQSLDFS
jgi:predicted nucleic acid-binding protein